MADRAPGPGGGDPGAIRAGYERLREAVLSGRRDGSALGLGVLATRGTVAWITAVSDVPAARDMPAALKPVASASSLPAAGEIVAVLAQMAFAIAA